MIYAPTGRRGGNGTLGLLSALLGIYGDVRAGQAAKRNDRRERERQDRIDSEQTAREGRAELRQQQSTQIGILDPLRTQYPNDARAITEAELGIASGQAALGPESQAGIPAGPGGMGPWRPRQYSLPELIKGKNAQELATERDTDQQVRNTMGGLAGKIAAEYENPLAFSPTIGQAYRTGKLPTTPPVTYQPPAAEWIAQADPLLATWLGPEVTNPKPQTLFPGGELVIPKGAGRRLTDIAREETAAQSKRIRRQAQAADAQKQTALTARGAAAHQSRSENALDAGAGTAYLNAFDQLFDTHRDYAQAAAAAAQARQDYLRAASPRVAAVAPVTPEKFNSTLPQFRTPGTATREQPGTAGLQLNREVDPGRMKLGHERIGLSEMLFGEPRAQDARGNKAGFTAAENEAINILRGSTNPTTGKTYTYEEAFNRVLRKGKR